MKETAKRIAEKARRNPAVAIGAAGAVAAGGAFGYAEIHKEFSPQEARVKIEVQPPSFNTGLVDGKVSALHAKPDEFVVVRKENGDLTAELPIAGNEVSGPAVEQQLESLEQTLAHDK